MSDFGFSGVGVGVWVGAGVGAGSGCGFATGGGASNCSIFRLTSARLGEEIFSKSMVL